VKLLTATTTGFICVLILAACNNTASKNEPSAKTAAAPQKAEVNLHQPAIKFSQTDWAEQNLRGKVKSYIDSSFHVINGPNGPERGIWKTLGIINYMTMDFYKAKALISILGAK
jgi:hypothetical protein